MKIQLISVHYEPYACTVTAEVDGRTTTWSGIRQLDGSLGHTGWESIDQWADRRTLSAIGTEQTIELGQEVLHRASHFIQEGTPS